MIGHGLRQVAGMGPGATRQGRTVLDWRSDAARQTQSRSKRHGQETTPRRFPEFEGNRGTKIRMESGQRNTLSLFVLLVLPNGGARIVSRRQELARTRAWPGKIEEEAAPRGERVEEIEKGWNAGGGRWRSEFTVENQEKYRERERRERRSPRRREEGREWQRRRGRSLRRSGQASLGLTTPFLGIAGADHLHFHFFIIILIPDYELHHDSL